MSPVNDRFGLRSQMSDCQTSTVVVMQQCCFLSAVYITWTNRWILTKLAQAYYWEGGKKWLDFGDPDLIFKVTPARWNFQILLQKSLSAPYLLDHMTDSGQTSFIVMLGWFKDLIRFWWPWPDFQGHHTIKTIKTGLVCTLSPEPIWWILTKFA